MYIRIVNLFTLYKLYKLYEISREETRRYDLDLQKQAQREQSQQRNDELTKEGTKMAGESSGLQRSVIGFLIDNLVAFGKAAFEAGKAYINLPNISTSTPSTANLVGKICNSIQDTKDIHDTLNLYIKPSTDYDSSSYSDRRVWLEKFKNDMASSNRSIDPGKARNI